MQCSTKTCAQQCTTAHKVLRCFENGNDDFGVEAFWIGDAARVGYFVPLNGPLNGHTPSIYSSKHFRVHYWKDRPGNWTNTSTAGRWCGTSAAQQRQRNSNASNAGHFALYSSTLTATIQRFSTEPVNRQGARKETRNPRRGLQGCHAPVTTIHMGLIHTETHELQPAKLKPTLHPTLEVLDTTMAGALSRFMERPYGTPCLIIIKSYGGRLLC